LLASSFTEPGDTMKDWYIRQHKPRQIERRCVWKEHANRVWTTLSGLPHPAKVAFVLMLLVLAASLTGCAATSTPSSEPARNPSPPPTTLSERSETFSSSAQRHISEWRKRLTELLPK
jgi:hypothetical protein